MVRPLAVTRMLDAPHIPQMRLADTSRISASLGSAHMTDSDTQQQLPKHLYAAVPRVA
jgi:hypothetical protein